MKRPVLDRLFGGATFDQRVADFAMLLLRVHVGYTMMTAGLDKFPTGSWFLEQVSDLGFPAPHLFAFLACFAEFGGGALLLVGLLSRPAAFLMAITMGVAAFRFHGEPLLFSMHISQLYFWACFFFAVAGAGRFSLDFAVRTVSVPERDRPARFPAAPVLAVPLLALLLGAAVIAERREITKPGSDIQIESIHLVGTLNDWSLEATPMTPTGSNTWQATLTVPQAGPLEFKFVGNRSWDINWGLVGAPPGGMPARGTAILDDKGNTANLLAFVQSSGVYEVRFSLDGFTYEVSPAAP